MTGFDLTTATREVIATRRGWNLDDLTDAVLAATPRAAVRDAYRTALREFVRQQLGHTDSRPGQIARGIQEDAAGAGQTPGTDQRPTDAQSRAVGAGPTSQPGQWRTRSPGERAAVPNLARSRTALFRISGFRERIHAARNEWKPLIDCTADELLFAAAENDQMSQRNAAAAARYRTLAKLLQEHGVTTPADLPLDVLREAFGDDRAA